MYLHNLWADTATHPKILHYYRKLMKLFKLTLLLLISGISAVICYQVIAKDTINDQEEIRNFIENLINAGDSIKTKKDLSPIQSLVGNELFQWIRSGVMFYPPTISHKQPNLKGHSWMYPDTYTWFEYYVDNDIIPRLTQDPHILMFSTFENLKKAPIIYLSSNDFDPYLPNDCEKDKKWYNKWIVYPGDYLLEEFEQYFGENLEKLLEEDKEMKSSYLNYLKNKAKKTIIYFKNGENFYFGITRLGKRWILQSIGIDYDCDV